MQRADGTEELAGWNPQSAHECENRPLADTKERIGQRKRESASGGDGGIRTLDTLLGHAHLANECLQPLGHVSCSTGYAEDRSRKQPGTRPSYIKLVRRQPVARGALSRGNLRRRHIGGNLLAQPDRLAASLQRGNVEPLVGRHQISRHTGADRIADAEIIKEIGTLPGPAPAPPCRVKSIRNVPSSSPVICSACSRRLTSPIRTLVMMCGRFE